LRQIIIKQEREINMKKDWSERIIREVTSPGRLVTWKSSEITEKGEWIESVEI
jgi:hypothetical protein